jgi:hypothetical protein
MMFENSSDNHYLVVAGDSSSHGHNIQRLLLHSSFAADLDVLHRHHSIGIRKVAGYLHSCLQDMMEKAQ